jgi:FkbM family methyltransferase
MNLRRKLALPRSAFENLCRTNAKYVYLGENEGLCSVLGGSAGMYVYTKDVSVAPHLMMQGFWEPWLTLALANVPEGSVCVDVGANLGYYSIALASLGASKVYAFEPQKRLVELLKNSSCINGMADTISVSSEAVGSETTAKTVLVSTDNPRNCGGTNLREIGDKNDHSNACTELIKFISLDDFMDRRQHDRLDFIKIDSEGYEYEVWKGASNSIEKYRPKILLEFSPSSYGNLKTQFLEEIMKIYHLQTVNFDGKIVGVTPEQVLNSPDFCMLWLEAKNDRTTT